MHCTAVVLSRKGVASALLCPSSFSSASLVFSSPSLFTSPLRTSASSYASARFFASGKRGGEQQRDLMNKLMGDMKANTKASLTPVDPATHAHLPKPPPPPLFDMYEEMDENEEDKSLLRPKPAVSSPALDKPKTAGPIRLGLDIDDEDELVLLRKEEEPVASPARPARGTPAVNHSRQNTMTRASVASRQKGHGGVPSPEVELLEQALRDSGKINTATPAATLAMISKVNHIPSAASAPDDKLYNENDYQGGLQEALTTQLSRDTYKEDIRDSHRRLAEMGEKERQMYQASKKAVRNLAGEGRLAADSDRGERVEDAMTKAHEYKRQRMQKQNDERVAKMEAAMIEAKKRKEEEDAKKGFFSKTFGL